MTRRAVFNDAGTLDDGSGTVGPFQPLDSDLTAIAALTTTTFGRALLELANAGALRTAAGLGTAATSNTGDFDAAGAAAAAQSASQPLDSDLTAIAALTTTTYGRAFLALADAAAGRTALGLGTAAVKDVPASGNASSGQVVLGSDTRLGAGSTVFTGAKAMRTAVQSHNTSGSWLTVLWDTEEFDTDAFHDNSTDTNRLTVPTAMGGKYLLIANVCFAANGTGIRGVQINKNSTTANTNVLAQSSTPAATGISGDFQAITMVALTAGDWISVNAFQNSGGNLNIANTLPLAYFIAQKVG